MTGQRRMLVDAWYRGAPWLWLLRPLELVFRALAALRRKLYRGGLLASYRSPVPVVVIGNITVGGTGKTPVVIALVEALQIRGIRVGVVSRGYGARADQYPLKVTVDSLAGQCSDEALMIQRRTGCPVVVAPDRAAAARLLLDDCPVDLILSDDGLQHYGLARDMEIVLLDARLGTGNGFCLPAGPLREPVNRLQAVDIVLYRGGEDPTSAVTYEPDCLVKLDTSEQRPASPQSLGGEKVYALAGIGQPRQFFDGLQKLGFELQTRSFADHYAYSAADFRDLADSPIIMTEKDAVKCASIAGDNAWYLRIDARLPAGLVDAVAALVHS